MAQVPFDELFSPEFLESVRSLRLIAGRVPVGGRFAEQRSKTMGHGIEFRDFRPYAPGDDLRSVDWNIYRRLGRVFLRLFEELEDLPVYLLPDVSASGFVQEHGATTLRAHAGLRTAMALGSIAFGQHDSVGLFPVADSVEVAMAPTSGANRQMSFARRLSEIEPGGQTDLAAALNSFGAMGLREGLVVLISDFFDPAGIDAVVGALGNLRHRLLLVQLWRPSDAQPDHMQGDLRLIDVETRAPLDLHIDDQVIARYRAAHAAFETKLIDFAERHPAGLLKLDVEANIATQLAGLFEGGRYEA